MEDDLVTVVHERVFRTNLLLWAALISNDYTLLVAQHSGLLLLIIQIKKKRKRKKLTEEFSAYLVVS